MAKDSKKREEKRVMKLRFETKVVPLHVVKKCYIRKQRKEQQKATKNIIYLSKVEKKYK